MATLRNRHLVLCLLACERGFLRQHRLARKCPMARWSGALRHRPGVEPGAAADLSQWITRMGTCRECAIHPANDSDAVHPFQIRSRRTEQRFRKQSTNRRDQCPDPRPNLPRDGSLLRIAARACAGGPGHLCQGSHREYYFGQSILV